MRSRKTTASGLAAAIGIILVFSAEKFFGTSVTAQETVALVEAIGTVLTAGGLLGAGLFARDDDVSSEGRKAPKDHKTRDGF